MPPIPAPPVFFSGGERGTGVVRLGRKIRCRVVGEVRGFIGGVRG